MIKALAIETSCDDTSIGIVEYADGVFSCPILKAYSQINDHQQFGGVVPEVAYRLHEEKILEIIREIGYDMIAECDFITVTKEPGLPGSLVVGNTVASMLGAFFNKPIHRVNHIYGHIFSLLLDRSFADLSFPWVILTASGGHNELYFIRQATGRQLPATNYQLSDEITPNSELLTPNLHIEKLGYSLDDAAGESFDKVARMLGGSYPGGPWIDKMARSGKTSPEWNFKRLLLDGKGTNMPQELIDQNINNFSFSGMKAQVHQLLQKRPLETLNEQDICNICRAFQECVSDILMTKLLYAAKEHNAKTIGLVGGVSANDRLFEKVKEEGNEEGEGLESIPSGARNDVELGGPSPRSTAGSGGQQAVVVRPTKKVYSMDNGAMIGVVGVLEHLSLI